MAAFYAAISAISPTLRIPTIQTSRAPIHDHDGLGAALVAHGGGRRERHAFAGDFDVFVVRDGDGFAHVTVFF